MSETEALKIHEAHERAELAHADKTLAPVSLTMAILAVLVATISMLGHRAHGEVLLAQTRANFQKAELVGKATQQHADTILVGMLGALVPQNNSQGAALKEQLEVEVARYAGELEQSSAEERRLETESRRAKRRADRMDLGEVFCEMALVLSSITLLSRRRLFWHLGIVIGVVGMVMALTAFVVT